jgi:hypothetical protein
MLKRPNVTISILMCACTVASVVLVRLVWAQHAGGDEELGLGSRLVRYEQDSTYGLAVRYQLAELERPEHLEFSVVLDASLTDSWEVSSASVYSVDSSTIEKCPVHLRNASASNDGPSWVADCAKPGTYAVEFFFRKRADETTTSELRESLRTPGAICVNLNGELRCL